MTSGGILASSGARRAPGGPGAPLPWLLRRANQRYRSAIKNRLAECGFGELPQPGYWALMILASGGADASRLIAEMGVSKQAISKLVDVLVMEGFVDRKPNDADRRRTDLLLSAKGRRAADVIGEAVRATEDTFVQELGPERLAGLVETLAQLTQPHQG
jgi:DNA-binding MarR family transcriptional regulator